jgi:hypothetical protein
VNLAAAAVRAVDTALECIDLALETLDLRVACLQILVETVALGDELLLPLPETLLLHLDLLGEALAQRLLLLLELGVVELSRACLAKLPCLHLLCAVCFVVVLLGGVNQVEHVGSDEDSAELLEVAVLLILDLGNTPGVLATLDCATVVGLDVLLGADDGEGHGVNQAVGVLHGGSIIVLERGLVDLNALSINDLADLQPLACVRGFWPACTYPLLELVEVRGAQCVGLGDNGDQVDACAQLLHDLDVKGLQGVAGGADEVQAGVDTEIDLIGTARLLLLQHVRLVLVVEELDDGLPRIAVVDIVAEAGRVDDSEADWGYQRVAHVREKHDIPLKNFSSSSALVISISTVLSICLWCRRLWSA